MKQPTIYRYIEPVCRDPRHAFEDAICEGRLSRDPKSAIYAGCYMYMGPRNDGRGDAFKHVLTREYLP